jgi:hypothetical protein
MDAVSQRRHIVVTGAHNDTCVRRHLRMQSDKMAAIKCHHRSTCRRRKRDNSGVRDALACLACLVWGEDVVAQLPQALDHGITAILVRIEPGHLLCFRRLLDGLLNLFMMGGIVVPGGSQIRRR